MKSTQSLQELYNNLNHHFGPVEARELSAVVLANVIGRLQDEGLPISAEQIEAGIKQAADDYKDKSKTEVA